MASKLMSMLCDLESCLESEDEKHKISEIMREAESVASKGALLDWMETQTYTQIRQIEQSGKTFYEMKVSVNTFVHSDNFHECINKAAKYTSDANENLIT